MEGAAPFPQCFLSASSRTTCMSAGPDGCRSKASIGKLPQKRAPLHTPARPAVVASDLTSVICHMQALKAARGGGGTRAGIGKLPQKRAALNAAARPAAILQNSPASSGPASASVASDRHVATLVCMLWYHPACHSSPTVDLRLAVLVDA